MKKSLVTGTLGRAFYLALALTALLPAASFGQDELAPVTRTYAITNVNIIQAPGRKIDMGTVVIKNGLITAVGKGIAVPPEAIVIKADSMYVYAGFIDGLSRTAVIKPKEENRERAKDPGNPTPERAGITPQNEVRGMLNPADKSIEELRALGFTVAQVVPYGNPLPGHAATVLLGGRSFEQMILVNKSALYAEMTPAQNVYPATQMAVMAKWRDLYKNATLAKNYESLYASNRNGLERPVADRILESFYPVIDQRTPVLFKADKLMETHRILTLKNELGFPLIMADVKEAWPAISKVKSSGAKVFLSLDLPDEIKKDDKKKDEKAKNAEQEALDKRKEQAIASYTAQAAEFNKAGIPFGFSTLSAKTKDIPANLRRMIKAGLTEDAALAALTTTPAQLLGLSDRLGSIDNGKMANLVITDKSYFNEKAKVRYVFVDGVLYKQEVKETKKSDGKVVASGNWSYTIEAPQGGGGKLTIKDDGGTLGGTITSSINNSESELKDVSLDGSSISFNYSLDIGSNKLKVSVTATIDGDTMEGTVTAGQMGSFPFKANRDPKK